MLKTTRLVSLLRLWSRPLVTDVKVSMGPATSFSSGIKKQLSHRPSKRYTETTFQSSPEPTAGLKSLPYNQEEPKQNSANPERISMTLIRVKVRAFSEESDMKTKTDESYETLRLLSSVIKTFDRDEFQKILDLIWSFIDPAKMEVSIYNAYLKAKIHGGLELDVERCLEEISQYGLSPNEETHQLFVEHFCENGQVDRALKYVSNLRTQDLTRGMYHSLLKGYLNPGDLDNGRRVLSQMRDQNIEPDAETYTIFACAFANWSENAEVLDIVAKRDLSSKQLFSVLSSATNPELMKKLCDQISQSKWSLNDAETSCAELIHARKLEQAKFILEKLIIASGHSLEFFPVQMVKSKYTAREISHFCRSLLGQKTRYSADQSAVEAATCFLDPLDALEFLSVFRERNFPVREHHCRPIISRARNKDELRDILVRMLSWRIPVSGMTLNQVFAKLLGDWSIEPQEALTLLKHLSFSDNLTEQSMVHYYIATKQFDECVRLIDMFDPRLWVKNVPLIARNTKPENQDKASILIDEISRRSRQISSNELMAQYQRQLKAGFSSIHNTKPTTGLTYSQPPNKWLVGQRKNRNEDLSRLTLACSKDDFDAVDQVLKVLNPDEFEGSSFFSLTNFYLRKKDLERAKYYYDRACNVTTETNDYIVLSLATLMIESGEYDEARTLIRGRKFKNRFKAFEQKSSKIAAVVNMTLRHVGLEAALDLISELVPQLRPIQSGALLSVVSYTLEHHPERCTEVLRDLSIWSGVTPGLLQVYQYLISRGKESEIEELFEIASDTHGRRRSCLFLAYSYILARDFPAAKKYLMVMPLDDDQFFHLKLWCQNSIKKNQIEDVEAVVEVMLQCGMTYDPLYVLLTGAYAESGEVGKATELWEKAQEYNVHISNGTLRSINRMFQRRNLKAPFPSIE